MRRKGFQELDDTLPIRDLGVDLQRILGLVVVPVGLDEPDETPDELAADNVEIEPFDDKGWQRVINEK